MSTSSSDFYEFLKAAAAAAPATTTVPNQRAIDVPPAGLPSTDPRPWANWAGNQTADYDSILRPADTDGVAAAVKDVAAKGQTLRILGRGASWSPLVPTTQRLMDMTGLQQFELGENKRRVTVGAGMNTGVLSALLAAQGLTLSTNTVIPWIQLGGVLGTAAHGTGRFEGTVPDLVTNVRGVDGEGNVRDWARGDSSGQFDALMCNLGSLAAISEITLECEPMFNLRAIDDLHNYYMVDTMGSPQAIADLLDTHDYAEVFWWPGTERCWVKTWDRTREAEDLDVAQWGADQIARALGARGLTEIVGLLNAYPPLTHLLDALMVSVLKHQRMVAQAPYVFHYQIDYPKVWHMSYAIDVEGNFENVYKAWNGVVQLLEEYRDRGVYPQNQAFHLRYIRGSDAWLSPSHGHNGSVAMELVTLKGTDGWPEYSSRVEDLWLDLGGRPHWGKIFSWGTGHGEGSPSADSKLDRIRGAYSKWDDFKAVRDDLDPNRRFSSDFARVLFED